jgi:hypothetical protein
VGRLSRRARPIPNSWDFGPSFGMVEGCIYHVISSLLNGPSGASIDTCREARMLKRNTDAAVLGVVSILYSIAIFFLKQRKA